VPIVEEGGPGLQMIRDGNCSRSFETLVRYRQAALAELTRCHKALLALQGEAQAEAEGAAAPARRPSAPAKRGTAPVPARPSAPAARPKARVPAAVPHPLATRQDLVATAAPPAPLPATAAPRDGLTAAIAAVLAAKRTRGANPNQHFDFPVSG
jgi:hypothetical protein